MSERARKLILDEPGIPSHQIEAVAYSVAAAYMGRDQAISLFLAERVIERLLCQVEQLKEDSKQLVRNCQSYERERLEDRMDRMVAAVEAAGTPIGGSWSGKEFTIRAEKLLAAIDAAVAKRLK